MIVEIFFRILTIIFTAISAYLFVLTCELGISYTHVNLTTIYKIALFIFFVFVSIKKIPYIASTLYALAYSYIIYKILHASFVVSIIAKQFNMSQDNYLNSPLVGIISIFLSSIATGLIPSFWKAGTSYIEYGAMAKQAGLFLAQKEAHHISLSKAFKEYLKSIKEIHKLKFKCITCYHTFVSEDSPFNEVFTNNIDHTVDMVEILLTDPEGKSIKRRAKILAANENKTKSEVIKELQEEIQKTLLFLNGLPYKEKINVLFCDDIEAKYKILLFNQVVLVQGYFGTQDIYTESIYGFKEIEKTISMYKFFQKLFDEKFKGSKKIHLLPKRYHLFNPKS